MSELTKTLRYELETNLASLKKFDTWIFLCILSAGVLLLLGEITFAIILLVVVLFLDAGRSHSTGQVTEWARKKYKTNFQDVKK